MPQAVRAELGSGQVIAAGVSDKLDHWRKLRDQANDWLADYQAQQRSLTGINNLKIKYNKVFGYYLEVSKSNLDKVPADYHRRQTLVNAERFITPALKEFEQKMLVADEKVRQYEQEVFDQLCHDLSKQLDWLQTAVAWLTQIDVLSSLAETAVNYAWTKPVWCQQNQLQLVQARHPVLEQLLQEKFVPNDVKLNSRQQLILLTGPNMAGKSVYMRQAALCVILAQMGSFVPAESARLSVRDRVFVRSGAGDAISLGLSTFMLEMVEAAKILNYATDKSLVILDEIGRGTSTYDGISLAWAIAEYLVVGQARPLVLFATHYHELQQLAKLHRTIVNYQMAVSQESGELVFLHQVKPGGASHSYGIHVARLAGLPEAVITQASQLLKQLEQEHGFARQPVQLPLLQTGQPEPSKLETDWLERIKQLEIDQLTPLQALQILADLQQEIL